MPVSHDTALLPSLSFESCDLSGVLVNLVRCVWQADICYAVDSLHRLDCVLSFPRAMCSAGGHLSCFSFVLSRLGCGLSLPRAVYIAGGHLPAGHGPAQGEHAGAGVLRPCEAQAQVQARHPVPPYES